MSRAFVKEPDGEAGDDQPELPISPHPNYVTRAGLAGLEARLEGAEGVPEIGPSDLAELSPIDDVRGSAAYRLDLVSETLIRVLGGML